MATSIFGDLASISIASARRAIQKRSQPQDALGRFAPGPTYEELRQRERNQLNGQTETIEPLGASVSTKLGNFFTNDQASEALSYNTPGQRVDRNLAIYDLIDSVKIVLPFVPPELDYTPESSFVSIASMARNNPLYHYTGSEDTLKFTIDWFSERDDRMDVITKCKQVEALSKNDSFERPPHKILLIWGETMFSDSQWLVVSAPYKLSQFQAHRGMRPQQAIQQVTLKRITELNSSRAQIQNVRF